MRSGASFAATDERLAMMKPSMVLALCGATLLSANALSAPPHVHGVATLDVVVEGRALQLTLDSPLANLLAFERAPRDAKETQMVRAMAQRFAAPDALFAPSPAAACTVTSVRLSSSVLDPKLLSVAGRTETLPSVGAAKPDEDGHADLQADMEWQCERPRELKGLGAGIFRQFPGMLRIDVQVVTPGRQLAATLTPKSTAISF
jgi:hypothetical protein